MNEQIKNKAQVCFVGQIPCGKVENCAWHLFAFAFFRFLKSEKKDKTKKGAFNSPYNQYDKLKSKQIKPRIVLKKRRMPDSLKRISIFLSLNPGQIVGKQSKIFVCYYERVIRLYVCIIRN